MKLTKRGRLQRGVLLLPSLFTLGNLFCGLFALRAATDWRMDGSFQLERAALFIVIAALLDGLDGKIARLAHATSPLGMQLDSLADVVSFGVAPGILVYTWALSPLGNLGWAAALLFTGCGAIRLARFNVQSDGGGQRHFVGLPIPAAAGAIAALLFVYPEPVATTPVRVLIAAWAVILSLLMVSRFRYHSFKQVDINRRQSVRTLMWVVLAFAIFSWQPRATLALAAFLYALSGPVARVVPGWGALPIDRDGEGSSPRTIEDGGPVLSPGDR